MRRLITGQFLAGYAVCVVAATNVPITPHPSSYWAGVSWWTMIHYIPFMVDATSFLLNIVMFVPFGVLVPLMWPRVDNAKRLFWYAAAASSAIELTQLILGLTLGSRRTVDINDVISNTAGAMAGFAMLRLAVLSTVRPLRPGRSTARRRRATPPGSS